MGNKSIQGAIATLQELALAIIEKELEDAVASGDEDVELVPEIVVDTLGAHGCILESAAGPNY